MFSSYTQLDIVTTAAYVITIAISFMSQAGLFGSTNAEVSSLNDTPLTPAGWTFSIWGVIFLTQGISVGYLMYRPDDVSASAKRGIVDSVGKWWSIGWACESLWQILFSYNSKLTLVLCFFLLVGATAAFIMALRPILPLRPDINDLSPKALAKHTYTAATAINTAWLTVATSAGFLIAIKQFFPSWTLVSLSVFLAVGITVLGVSATLEESCITYGLTLVWSFWGIAAASDSMVVTVTAWFALAIMVGMSIAAGVMRWGEAKDNTPDAPLLNA